MQSGTRKRRRDDAGAAPFLFIILVGIALMVVLGAVFGPRVMDYLNRGHDASVQSDLQNYATAAQANLINNGGSAYIADPAGFTTDATAPQFSKDNHYRAWVQEQGSNAGFVIVGMNANSEQAFGISSYNGAAVQEISGIAAMDAFNTLTSPPADLLDDGMSSWTGSGALTWGGSEGD